MIDQELIERVTRLPVSQRLELIELLTHSLREELVAPPMIATEPISAEADDETIGRLAAIERLALSHNLDVSLDSSLRRIIGVVPSRAVPMTKDEVRDLITDYLIEKHS